MKIIVSVKNPTSKILTPNGTRLISMEQNFLQIFQQKNIENFSKMRAFSGCLMYKVAQKYDFKLQS